MSLHGAAWMVGGLVVAALEMLAPGAFLLWIGLGALLAGIATELFGLGLPAQLAVFVVATLVLVAAVVPRLRQRRADAVNAAAAGLVGQNCRALHFDGPEGRVSLADTTWSARAAPGAPPPRPGDPLLVTGLDGTVLLVSPRPGAY